MEQDAYAAYLRQTIEEHKQWCLEEVERMGYPGKIKYANQAILYALEAYEDALAEYERFKQAEIQTPDTPKLDDEAARGLNAYMNGEG